MKVKVFMIDFTINKGFAVKAKNKTEAKKIFNKRKIDFYKDIEILEIRQFENDNDWEWEDAVFDNDGVLFNDKGEMWDDS